MDPIFGGQLVDRFMALEGFQGNPGFELGALLLALHLLKTPHLGFSSSLKADLFRGPVFGVHYHKQGSRGGELRQNYDYCRIT